jgi:eukaryotic-like serine/threonine-protein kinase
MTDSARQLRRRSISSLASRPAPTRPLTSVPSHTAIVGRAPRRGERIARRYQIVERIGQGGMGEVLLAHDDVLGRFVAIKRGRVQLRNDAPYLLQLRHEARIGARLTHRAVVQVHDLVVDDGIEHLVMELVGPSLRQQLRGKVAPDEVQRIGLEVAGGLVCAHARGVVHLDLKLENVLLAPDGQP